VQLDELYWFLERKSKTETRESIYIIKVVGREPDQITGYCVSMNKSSQTIQKMMDASPEAETYLHKRIQGLFERRFSGKTYL